MPVVNDLFIFVSMPLEGAIRVPRAGCFAAAANLRTGTIAQRVALFPFSHIGERGARAWKDFRFAPR
jgi:hypothetical protein